MSQHLEEQNESPIVVVDKNGIPIRQDTQLDTLSRIAALPASQESVVEDYTKMIWDSQICIIRAETWAGKTTQIPKNIRRATWARINVTQPRVLSAISNAQRISHELLCETKDPKYTLWYSEIWYRTWVDVSSRRSAWLSLNTAGLEMMRQFYSGLYADITFLDEIQWFGTDLEVLMYLFKTRRDVNSKLVIMSATINPDVFHDYFWKDFWEIPVLDIPWRTYPVKNYYYDNKEEAIAITLDLISQGKSWLFFVSWKWELYSYIEKFKAAWVTIPIYPLHAELTEEEQMHAVINTQREQRLIIATNVAEESITPEGIQYVVDLWTHKVSYPNDLWIEELVKEDISKANSQQRGWRGWRTEDGEYHRFNSTDIDDLDDYPVPPVSKNLLDREILLFLNKWLDLAELHSKASEKWETLFAHGINSQLLPISYARLKAIWAISDKWKITRLWKDILGFNLDIYHARMLLQSIEEWCLEEMIYMVCILSSKGFLWTTDKWKELFTSTHHKETDVIYFMKMLVDFSSRTLTRAYTNKLAWMGIDYMQIDAFHAQTGPKSERKMFFEMVDLSPIGVKNYKLAEINNLIFVIQKRLMSQGITVDTDYIPKVKDVISEWKLPWIQTSLHAWYPFFLWEYKSGDKRFSSRVPEAWIGNLEFTQAKTSLISPSWSKQYSFYPFIIERADKENLNLASFITEVPDGAEKSAINFQNNYSSKLENTTKKTPSWPTIDSVSKLDEKYEELLWDFKNISSEDEFSQIILPVLVLAKNHKFKRFIARNPAKIWEMIQRLQRFFKRNLSDYKHRINLNDIKKIERSFMHDTALYADFRSWERKFVDQRKKQQKQRNPHWGQAAFELHQQEELARKKEELIKLIWVYESWSFNLKFQEIRKRTFNKFFRYLLENSAQLNELISFHKMNIDLQSIQEAQDVCKILSERSKKIRLIPLYKRYSRWLQNIISEIEKLLEENESVDLNFLRKFTEGRFFKNDSRSQKEKFLRAVNTLWWVSSNKISVKERSARIERLEEIIWKLKEKKNQLLADESREHNRWVHEKNFTRLIDVLSKIVNSRWVNIPEEIELGSWIEPYFKDDSKVLGDLKLILKRFRQWATEHFSDKKISRSKSHLRQFITRIKAEIETNDIEIWQMNDEIEGFWELSYIQDLKFLIKDFLESIFSPEYYQDHLDSVLDDIVRSIFRNKANEDREPDEVIRTFLESKWFVDSITDPDIDMLVSAEKEFRDLYYELETSFSGKRAREFIVESEDIDEITDMYNNLWVKIERLKELKWILSWL